MYLFLWFLTTSGLTSIVVTSKLFHSARESTFHKEEIDIGTGCKHQVKTETWLSNIVTCSQCFGFYAGIFMSLTLWSPTQYFFKEFIWLDWSYWIYDGMIGSIISYISYLFMTWLSKKNLPGTI